MGNHAAAPGIFYWTCPSGHVQFVSVSLCDNVSCSQRVRMMLCKIFVIVEILQKDRYQQQADLRTLCVALIWNVQHKDNPSKHKIHDDSIMI